MELIERYVHEVGRRLPTSMRADVCTELWDLLAETLDERAARESRSCDEAMVVDVLKKFGEPASVAARYWSGERGLVGPQFYALFRKVCQVILTGTALISLFVLAFLLPSSKVIPE